MLLIILALAVGFIFGSWRKLPQAVASRAGSIMRLGLVVLLFAMGVSIGSDPQVIGALSRLGVQAVGMAVISTAGSALLAHLVERLFIERGEDVES